MINNYQIQAPPKEAKSRNNYFNDNYIVWSNDSIRVISSESKSPNNTARSEEGCD